jgi:hypothetical protein
MNACVIMHNKLGKKLDYSCYKLIGRLVHVEKREDRIAKFLESYHSIRDDEVHNNLQKNLIDEW